MADRYLTQQEIDAQVKAMRGEQPYETAPDIKTYETSGFEYNIQHKHWVAKNSYGQDAAYIYYDKTAGMHVLQIKYALSTREYLRALMVLDDIRTRYGR